MGRVVLPFEEASFEERVDLLLNMLARHTTFPGHAWHRRRAAEQNELEHAAHGSSHAELGMQRLRPLLQGVKQQSGFMKKLIRLNDKYIVK